MKNETKEPEVITFKEFSEGHKNMEEEEMHKIVLVCKNCNHKDLLKNFIKKVENKIGMFPETKPKYIPDPWKPSPPKPHPDIKPYLYKKWRHPIKYRTQSNSKKINKLASIEKEYEDMFYCPKCGSSLVVLDKDFIKNNILRGLK